MRRTRRSSTPSRQRPRARPGARRSLIGPTLLAALTFATAGVPPGGAAARAAEAPTRAGQRDTELTRSLNALLDGATFLKGAQLGVSVVDVETGAVLYSREPDLPLNPASGIKVFTTAAALAVLGPEARFATRLYTDKDALEGKVIRGDLYLVGGGDPVLVSENLYKLADDLHTRGVRTITGGIVIDASAFDGDGLPPGFDQKTEFAAYRAPSGAASLNFNTFVATVYPGAAKGAAARVAIVPPVPSIRVTNRVTTDAGRRDRVIVSPTRNQDGTIDLEFGGTIGVDLDLSSYRYPVQDPSRYAGETLRLILEQRGVKVSRADIRSARKPANADRLATHYSRSLGVLVRSVNKLSNNFMAEQILKLIDTVDDEERSSGPATVAGALARVRAHLQTLGVNLDGFRMTNGSGLYDTNRVTAAQMAGLLAATYRDFSYAADFVASLPIAGADGTLRRRLRDTPQARQVRAKTGTLNGVSSLSGYAGADGRRPLAFSILVNGFEKWKIGKVRRLQNELAVVLAEHAGRPR